jgi:hypothetical protein
MVMATAKPRWPTIRTPRRTIVRLAFTDTVKALTGLGAGINDVAGDNGNAITW